MEENDNALMVVAESYCRYKSPAFYEDMLIVRTQVAEYAAGRSGLFMRSCGLRYGALLAEGETLHLVTDKEKKVRQVPEIYKERLMSEPQSHEGAFPAAGQPSLKQYQCSASENLAASPAAEMLREKLIQISNALLNLKLYTANPKLKVCPAHLKQKFISSQ